MPPEQSERSPNPEKKVRRSGLVLDRLGVAEDMARPIETAATWKRYLTIVIVLLVLIAGLDVMLYLTARDTERSYRQQREKHLVAMLRQDVVEDLRSAFADLLYLAEKTELSGVLEVEGMARIEGLNMLSREYLAFFRSAGVYDRICLLDVNGRLAADVNWDKYRPEIGEWEGPWFQDDDGFREAFHLDTGEIYLSPLDLVEKKGRIELPYQPIIRMGKPVFDRQGAKKGLLLVNYLGENLLNRIRRVAAEAAGRVMLLNAEAYWLLGLRPQDEWGFRLEGRRDLNLARLKPGVWAAMNGVDEGQFQDREGLYTFSAVYPLLEARRLSVGRGYRLATRSDGRSLKAYSWTIAAFLEKQALNAESNRDLLRLSLLNVLVLALLAAGTIFLFRYEVTRRQAMRELRKLSQAVEQSPATVVITDTEGRITYTNPKFTETTGYTAAEALGQKPSLLKSGKQPPELYERLWRTIASGGEWRGELQNKRKDGELYWEFASMSPIKDEEGRITHFLAVKEDITERKRAEIELRKAIEAAEAANRAKGEFLANMSHEIRTPMNGIIGLTDLLIEADPTPRQREYLVFIQKSARALLGLLSDVLDLSRIESGRFDLEAALFSFRQTLTGALRVLAPRAHEKNLELVYQVKPAVPDALIGDSARLRQILLNLAGNAIKFTPAGEVTVEAALHSISAGRAIVLFTVADTGIGIPAEKYRQIFSPFTQADGSLTREYGGIGLGLSITSQLVDMMGGRIWLESEVGRGSTFHFTASFILGEVAPRPGPTEAEALVGVKALLVDDNPTARRILGEELAGLGMKIVSAAGGREALALLEKAASNGDPFRLALVDDRMPDLDGRALLEGIKLRSALGGLKTILLLTAEQPGDGRAHAFGADQVLNKPVGPVELREACLAALDLLPPFLHRLEPLPLDEPTGMASITPLKVLLAEDEGINQQAARSLLERRGHRVVAVENGRQVLEALARENFDLILMNARMPEMDGLTATKLIREKERVGVGHVPILAMTAEAMKGDRETCLAAGMDGYLAKPIEAGELYRAITSVLPEARMVYRAEPDSPEPILPVMEKKEVLNLVGGDEVLLRELAGLFLKELPLRLGEIEAAVKSADPRALSLAARQLKASAATFAAKASVRTLKRLEDMGSREDLASAPAACDLLKIELERLKRALADLTALDK
ncbi:MAG: response regulator [Thermodesulfobacteriota bacterium]